MAIDAPDPLTPPTPACLDAEALAAWADRSLPAGTMAAVEAHLADCSRCQAMMAAFVRTEPPAPARTPFWRRSPGAWLVPLAGVAAAVGLVTWIHHAEIVPATMQAPSRMVAETVPPATPAATASAAEKQTAPAEAKASAPPRPKERVAVPSRPLPPAPPTPTQAPRPAAGAAITTSANAAMRTAVPPAAATAPVVSGARADTTGAVMAQMAPPPANATEVVAEFVETDTAPDVPAGFAAAGGGGTGGGRAGGGGRGGGGGGRGAGLARPAGAAPMAALSTPLLHWRILGSGQLERSKDGGAAWEQIALDPGVHLTSGLAPARYVCWVIGRGGVVMRSTDGLQFTKIPFPAASDLLTITATDDTHATVTTVSGETYVTTDGHTFTRKDGTRFDDLFVQGPWGDSPWSTGHAHSAASLSSDSSSSSARSRTGSRSRAFPVPSSTHS